MGSISAYDKMSYSQAKLPSLEEMMMAPAYMQQQHDLALEEGTKLMTEANLAANLAMEDQNSEAARNYKAYIGNIEQAVDLLNTKGLKGSNIKSAISAARARYTKDIMPIIQAGAVREKDREIIQKAGLDPTMLIDVDPAQLSIDSYMKRGNQSYLPNMVSGSELEKATANSAKQLSDQIRTSGATLFTDTNLPFQYLAQIQKGASINEVQDAMIREGRNPEDVNTMTMMLRNIVDNTLKTYGIYDKFGNNKQLIDRAWGYAANGLYSAIGKSDTQIVTDEYGKQVALQELAAAIQRRELEAARERQGVAPIFYRDKSFIENSGAARDFQKIQENLGLVYGEEKPSSDKPLVGETTSAILQFMGPMLRTIGKTTTGDVKQAFKNSPIARNLVGTIDEITKSMDKQQAAAIEPLAKKYGISLRDSSGKLKPKAEIQFELEDAKEYSVIGLSARAFDLEGDGSRRLGRRLSEGQDKSLNEKILLYTEDGDIKGINGTMYFEKYLGDLAIRNADGKHSINPNLVSTQAATIMENIRMEVINALGLEGVDVKNPIPVNVFAKGYKNLVDDIYGEVYAEETKAYQNAISQIEASQYTIAEKKRLGEELQIVTINKLKAYKQMAAQQVEQYLNAVTENDINIMNKLMINFTGAQKPVNFELNK